MNADRQEASNSFPCAHNCAVHNFARRLSLVCVGVILCRHLSVVILATKLVIRFKERLAFLRLRMTMSMRLAGRTLPVTEAYHVTWARPRRQRELFCLGRARVSASLSSKLHLRHPLMPPLSHKLG